VSAVDAGNMQTKCRKDAKVMGEKNTISVVLCTYNGERFLPAQLESICAQTRQPDEMIVNDDVSTDRTIEIIEDFSKKAPFPVKLEINSQNLGSTKNFERAIWRATGSIIFLCDQDDVWLSHKIEKIKKIFDSDDSIGLVFSDAVLIDEYSHPIGKNLWDYSFPRWERKKNMLEVLLRQNVVTGATAAFRSKFREVFSPIPTDIPNLIHDGWIALVISAFAKVQALDEKLIMYRQHPQQQLGIIRELSSHKDYKEVIYFEKKEIQRLEKMRSALQEFPAFQSGEISNSIQNILDLYIREKQERVEHLQARTDLPKLRFQRLIPIWRELLTGRYHRFSRGFLSAAKDFLLKD
jgi:glycosyltransferase involved in cell wall biosynthesis